MGGEQHDEMPGDAVFAAVSRLRARRSQGGRTRGAGATAYRLYLAFLILAPPIYLVINALGEVPRADAVTIDGLISRLTIVVPLVLLALGIATLRVATWTGPVIITAADVPFMLSLPFPRRLMLLPALRRALGLGAAAGAALGGAITVPYHLTVGLPPEGAADLIAMGAAGGVGGAMYGVTVVALAWMVERRRPLARLLARSGGVAIAFLVGLSGVAWIGPIPPDWASVVGPRVGILGTTLLLIGTVTLTRQALRSSGDVPIQELARRAATGRQVMASAVYFADFRAAARARDQAISALVGRSRRRPRLPRRLTLLVPWIGATILLRHPRRPMQALLWMLGAVWMAGLGAQSVSGGRGSESTGFIALMLAATAGYVAAGLLVEPLRVEIEQRFGIRTLPRSVSSIGFAHLLVPIAALWLLGMLSAALISALGILPTGGLALATVAMPFVAIGLVMSAAVVASGRPPDDALLYLGESGMTRLVVFLTRGPQLAALFVGGPLLLTSSMAVDGVHLPTLGGGWALWTVGLVVGLGLVIRGQLRR